MDETFEEGRICCETDVVLAGHSVNEKVWWYALVSEMLQTGLSWLLSDALGWE